MKRRNFIKQLGVVTALPLLGRATIAAAAETPVKANTGSHKILSCNIRMDVPEDSHTGDGWAQRKEFCGDVIAGQKADLIGLQETQEAQLTYLKSRLPEYDTFALLNPGSRPNNVIFFLRSRYELISAGGFWLSETPHIAGSKSWDSNAVRFVNWVHLKEKSSGKEFRYWNTHLDHKGDIARAKAATLIVEASQAFPKELPQILSGDMNADLNHPAIKNYKEGGWLDTFTAVNGPKDPGYTYHGFKGKKRANAEDKNKIDWIFYRGSVKPLAAAVLRDDRNGHYPSDHYFLSAEVVI